MTRPRAKPLGTRMAVADVIHNRPEVAVLAEADWQLHAVPLVAYDRLKSAATGVLYAEAKLDEADAEARRVGLSWSEVGRATGMTRPSAHQRWG